jgi:hypothetical protein
MTPMKRREKERGEARIRRVKQQTRRVKRRTRIKRVEQRRRIPTTTKGHSQWGSGSGVRGPWCVNIAPRFAYKDSPTHFLKYTCTVELLYQEHSGTPKL